MSDSTVDPAAAAAIHRDLADLQKQIRDLKSLQASGRRWVLATMFIVVLMFAAFSFGLYARIKHNFNDQAVQKAVSEQGDQIVPMATSMLEATGQTLLPVYRDAALAVLRKDGPVAGQVALDKLRAIPQDSGVAFQEKMRAAFDAAVKRVEPDLKAAYPKLADDRRQQVLQSFMADQIAVQNQRLALQANELYQNDLARMQRTLEKFDVPPADREGMNGLERQFLHTMVALLDDQIDTAYPAPAGEPAIHRSPRPPTTGPAMGAATPAPAPPAAAPPAGEPLAAGR